MNRLNTSLLSIFLILYSISFSQTFTAVAEDFTKRNSIGVISDKNDVEGYFIFYRLKNKKFKMGSRRNYVLHILDKNLNKVNSDTMIGSYQLKLLEGTSNGENLMFKLYDPHLKTMTYLNYDDKGKLLNKELEKVLRVLQVDNLPAVNYDFQSNESLFPIKNKGFVSYKETYFKRQAYTINFLPNNKETVQPWQYSSNKKSKRLLKANYLYNTENFLFNLVSSTKNKKGVDLKYYLQCLDLNTGKEIVKIDLSKYENKFSLTNAYFDEIKNHITVFGEYYAQTKRTLRTPSTGIFTLTFDLKGNAISGENITWATDVNKFIDVTVTGKARDRNYTYFHKFFKAGDGNIYAIGEEFRKKTNASGVVANVFILGVLGAALLGDATEFIIDDLVIYKFSSEFELLDVKTIEKEPLMVGFNGRYTTPHQWARRIKASGGFSYAYTTINETGNSFVVNYIDYTMLKNEYAASIIFKSCLIKNEDMELNEELLGLHKSKVNNRFLPAKKGYFLFSEYIRKEDKLILDLRKINFDEKDPKKSSSN